MFDNLACVSTYHGLVRRPLCTKHEGLFEHVPLEILDNLCYGAKGLSQSTAMTLQPLTGVPQTVTSKKKTHMILQNQVQRVALSRFNTKTQGSPVDSLWERERPTKSQAPRLRYRIQQLLPDSLNFLGSGS